MGQDPPAFDILAWNADSTRMPAAMHAFYLRNFYVREQAGAGTLEIAGRTIDLSVIKYADLRRQRDQRPHRAVGVGVQDHVGLVSGPVRFVLGSGGHIAGHRQPAGPEGVVHGRTTRRPLPSRRRRGGRPRERKAGSWWEDWAALVGARPRAT